jgi:NTE family protein
MTTSSNGNRVALVVGSGSVKCAAALGLWRVLKREGIELDMVVGCSGGSLYTAAMALGFDQEETERLTMKLWTRKVTDERNWRGLLSVFMPKAFRFDSDFGLVKDRAVLASLTAFFGERTFADTTTPLYIVATDLHNGEKVVMSSGRIVDAIRASFAFHNLAHHTEIIPILPEFKRAIGLYSTKHIPYVIEEGERAAEAQLPYIRRLLSAAA